MKRQELREKLERDGFDMFRVALGPVDPTAWDVFGIVEKSGQWIVYYSERHGLNPIASFAREEDAVAYFLGFADKNIPKRGD